MQPEGQGFREGGHGWSGYWYGFGITGDFPAGAPVSALARNRAGVHYLDVFAVSQLGQMVTREWSSTAGWSGYWYGLGAAGDFPAGAPVAALARNLGPDQYLDVFAVSPGGQMRIREWSSALGWSPAWLGASGPNLFPSGARVTALVRELGMTQYMDVFAVTQSGQVHTRQWSSAGQWSG